MNAADRRLWLDLQAARYLAAIDAEDIDAQDAVWALAAKDTELEEALHAVHEGVNAERDAEAARAVADAVAQHLPSAEVIRLAAGPVTVGMVAAELFRHAPGKLSAAAHQLNDRLRQSAEELPTDLGLSKLTAWAEARFGPAEAGYWAAFRAAALKLELRAAAEVEYQLAARQAPKRGGGR